MSQREPGYYWVQLKYWPVDDAGWWLGSYHPENEADEYPWEMIGSDEIYRDDEIRAVSKTRVAPLQPSSPVETEER